MASPEDERSWRTHDSEAPHPSFIIRSLREGIQEVWEEKKMKARFKFGLLLVQFVFNTVYTGRNVYCGAYRYSHFSQHEDASLFGEAYFWISLFEIIAIATYLTVGMGHLVALRMHHRQNSAPQSMLVVRNLERAASFSFFVFLPGPSKAMYVWNHRDILHDVLLNEPESLRMRREGREGTLYFSPLRREAREFYWDHFFDGRHCCHRCPRLHDIIKKMLFVIASLFWFWVRVLQPILILFCILVAIPAVILKLAFLPNFVWLQEHHIQWPTIAQGQTIAFKIFFPYAGIIMQAERTWQIREIEFVTLYSYLSHIYGGVTSKLSHKRIYTFVVDAIAAQLSQSQAMAVFTILDAPLLATILRRTYGELTPTRIKSVLDQITES